MSPRAHLLIIALSLVSLGMAATALILSERAASPRSAPLSEHTPGARAESAAVVALEAENVRLRSELFSVNARLAALEVGLAAADQADSGSGIGSDADEARAARLDAQIAAAVDAVLDRRGVDLVQEASRALKREEEREGMSKWVRSLQDRLPTITERLALSSLPPQTRSQVEEIFDHGFQAMAALADELYAEPPPSLEDSYQIMGEVKNSVGTMIGQLGEVLTGRELVEVGMAAIHSEMRSIGSDIIGVGKREIAAEEQGGGFGF